MEATAQESGAVAACRGDMHGRGSSNPYRAKGCRTAMTAFWFCKVHFSPKQCGNIMDGTRDS